MGSWQLPLGMLLAGVNLGLWLSGRLAENRWPVQIASGVGSIILILWSSRVEKRVSMWKEVSG